MAFCQIWRTRIPPVGLKPPKPLLINSISVNLPLDYGVRAGTFAYAIGWGIPGNDFFCTEFPNQTASPLSVREEARSKKLDNPDKFSNLFFLQKRSIEMNIKTFAWMAVMGVAALVAAPAAMADGYYVSGGYSSGYYYPPAAPVYAAPAYYYPAPVYAAPVYYAPAPVYYAPAPVYYRPMARPVYVARPVHYAHPARSFNFSFGYRHH